MTCNVSSSLLSKEIRDNGDHKSIKYLQSGLIERKTLESPGFHKEVFTRRHVLPPSGPEWPRLPAKVRMFQKGIQRLCAPQKQSPGGLCSAPDPLMSR